MRYNKYTIKTLAEAERYTRDADQQRFPGADFLR